MSEGTYKTTQANEVALSGRMTYEGPALGWRPRTQTLSPVRDTGGTHPPAFVAAPFKAREPRRRRTHKWGLWTSVLALLVLVLVGAIAHSDHLLSKDSLIVVVITGLVVATWALFVCVFGFLVWRFGRGSEYLKLPVCVRLLHSGRRAIARWRLARQAHRPWSHITLTEECLVLCWENVTIRIPWDNLSIVQRVLDRQHRFVALQLACYRQIAVVVGQREVVRNHWKLTRQATGADILIDPAQFGLTEGELVTCFNRHIGYYLWHYLGL